MDGRGEVGGEGSTWREGGKEISTVEERAGSHQGDFNGRRDANTKIENYFTSGKI